MLGRTFGRWDWWNLKKEHTPDEWALQIATYQVDPWGEVRADLRAAQNTVALIARNGMSNLPEDEHGRIEVLQKLLTELANYISKDKPALRPEPSGDVSAQVDAVLP